jgi:hypothetical protein
MTPKAARLAAWRTRLPVVAVVVACVAGVVSAVTGAANPVSAVQFLLPGHWVYNASLQSAFHVDGSTGSVNAQAKVPGSESDQVFEGDTSGYVVGSSRITEFGKSSLEVAESTTPPSRKPPVGVETVGGPYLVYREDGKVVRLGHPSAVLSLGGPVGDPVATRDGTLWLPRTSAGLLCQLPARAKTVSCPVLLPKGHAGALTVVDDRLIFVDTTADTLRTLEKDGLSEGRDLGVDVQDDARLATTDVAGRVAILDGNTMHLVDTGLDASRAPAKPVTLDLGAGDFDGPVSTGSVVAVVERTTHTLSTYGSDGKKKESKDLPADDGDPRISRGEDDRIYVDSADGEHVVVVDKDGGLTDVPIKDEGGAQGPGAKPQGGKDPDAQQPPAPPSSERPDTDKPEPDNPETDKPAPPVEQDKPKPSPQGPPPQKPPPEVPASAPGAPTAVAATAGDASATVTWGPAPDNRSAITGYTVAWVGGSTTVGPAATAATVPGLANGTSYVFTVTAVNGVGAGPTVSSNPVIPTAPFRAASAPLNLVADNDTGNSTVSASWAAPADMGTGTFVHYLVNIVGVRQTTSAGESFSFNDIQIDQELTIQITAVTAAPDGQQTPGATATVVTGQQPSVANVQLSRGPATSQWCGPDPACAWMHVVLTGFPPNTDVYVKPYSTNTDYQNGGHTFTVDGNGAASGDQFAYAGVGETVHVNADFNGQQVRSNDVFWGAG